MLPSTHGFDPLSFLVLDPTKQFVGYQVRNTKGLYTLKADQESQNMGHLATIGRL
jgi:hypothetical protein